MSGERWSVVTPGGCVVETLSDRREAERLAATSAAWFVIRDTDDPEDA